MTHPLWRRLIQPGLLLFSFTLPLSKSASTALIVALYALTAAGVALSREFRADVGRSCRQPLTAAFALFSLVAYAGVTYTLNRADGFAVANKFVTLPLVYFLTAVLLESEKDQDARARQAEFLLLSFLAGVAALNLLGVAQYLVALAQGWNPLPLSPLGMHHLWYANLNAIGIYVAVSLLLFSRDAALPGTRRAISLFLALSAFGILLSASRTAWLSIALTAAIIVPLIIRRGKRLFYVSLLSVLTFALVYEFVPIVHERMNLIVDDYLLFSTGHKVHSSLGIRFSMWEASWMMFRMYPWLGIGTGDYYGAMRELNRVGVLPDFLLRYNQPHNMYIFTMATNGMLGLTALLYIFYRSIRCAVASVRKEGTHRLYAFLALATAIHFMTAGLMDSLFNIQVLRYSFAFVMGICIRDSLHCARRP